jgi:recombinational DNA repair ATPase RecF
MDIRLKRLKCENFMNIDRCDLDLDYNKILLVGNNGEGKSAALDAISLCLSSKKRSNTFSEYIKQGHTSAHVELWCEINGEGLYFNITIQKSLN